jgi:hypothetical protein
MILAGTIQLFTGDANGVCDFEALIDTQVGVPDIQIPRKIRVITAIEPICNGNGTQIERRTILRARETRQSEN